MGRAGGESGGMWLTETQKIGVGMTTFGVVITMMGVLLFFDRGLLSLGNLLFLAGIMTIIGPVRTGSFFFGQRRKWRGSACFFGGMGCVLLLRQPVLGMLLEGIGTAFLFGDFVPVLLQALQQVPVIGTLLSMPGIAKRLNLGPTLPV